MSKREVYSIRITRPDGITVPQMKNFIASAIQLHVNSTGPLDPAVNIKVSRIAKVKEIHDEK